MGSFDRFHGRSTADEVLASADVRGKRAVVTGANTGMGYQTARALAAAGARVVFACRNPETGRAAVERAMGAQPGCQASFGALDLASFASVRAFSDSLAGEALDILVCNAGVYNGNYREVQSGFEHTVGVCHLGHFLLTLRLLPQLLQARAPRVVLVASESHRMPSKLDFDRLPMPRSSYRGILAYGQAKLCNVLMAKELQRRYGDQGLTSCALHPGMLVTTEIGRGSLATRIGMRLVSPFTKNANQGAGTIALCASHPEPSEVAGLYFLGCRPKRSSQQSNDPEVAARLWSLSEAWVAQ